MTVIKPGHNKKDVVFFFLFFISVNAHQKVYSASLMIKVRQLVNTNKKIKY